MSIARLFRSEAPDSEKLLGEIEALRLEKNALRRAVDELGQLNQKLHAELHNTRRRKSGTYNFRIEEVREMSVAVQSIEKGQTDIGVKIMTEVLDELDPRWREFG